MQQPNKDHTTALSEGANDDLGTATPPGEASFLLSNDTVYYDWEKKYFYTIDTCQATGRQEHKIIVGGHFRAIAEIPPD